MQDRNVMERHVFSYEEARAATLDYFNGDDLATDVFLSKYALRRSGNHQHLLELTPQDLHRRLAKEFARIEMKFGGPNALSERELYLWMDQFKYIVPQGSPMYGIGNDQVVVSLSNCVVTPPPEDTMSSIMDTGKRLANLFKRRCGVGTNLSKLRPDSAPVNNSAGTSTGAWSFADFYSYICRMVAQRGRRGALMLVMHVKHPDIFHFTRMKQDLTKVTGANVSIQITDDFMEAVEKDTDFTLQWPVDVPLEEATYTREIRARELWDEITRCATATAEPGLMMWDTILRNLPAQAYADVGFDTTATNPCVTGDTLILTSEGPFCARDLVGKPFEAMVHGKRHPSTDQGFWSTGLQRVFHLKTKEGFSLRLTGNHKLLKVEDEIGTWKEVSDLKPGDKIQVQNHQESFSWGHNGQGEFEKGRGMGLFLGENPHETISSSQLLELEQTSSEFHKGFLRGIFERCGAFFNPFGFTLGLSLSPTTLISVQRMLCRFGVFSQISRIPFPSLEKDPSHVFPYYQLKLSHENTFRLVEMTGLSEVWSSQLAYLAHNSTPSFSEGPFLAEVDSIVFDREEEVFDCTIPGAHCFDANGITSHNCGEIPLSLDSCRLVSLCLRYFVQNPFEDHASFDFDLFSKAVVAAMRMSDDLVELELEKLQQIIDSCDTPDEKEMWQEYYNSGRDGRRTGLGTHGLADVFACLGLPYDSPEALELCDHIYGTLKEVAYATSMELAKERGAFPVFDWNKEKDNEYIQRLPQWLQEAMSLHGRRNISILTNAPTGSTSLMSRSSQGIEPVFRNYYSRRRKVTENMEGVKVDFVNEMGEKWETYTVFHPNAQDYLERTGASSLPAYFVTSDIIDWRNRVRLQGIIQSHIDHSISSTINLPKGTPFELVGQIYMESWRHGLKGVTVYVDGSRGGVLIADDEETSDVQITYHNAPKRPETLDCEIHFRQVQGEVFILMVGLLEGRPYELFGGLWSEVYEDIKRSMTSGKIRKRAFKSGNKYDLILENGHEILEIQKVFNNTSYEVYTRMVSMSLRHGVEPRYIVDQLQKDPHSDMHSFSKVISRVLKSHIGNGLSSTQSCPECENKTLVYEGGCVACHSCGYSACG